MATSQTDTLRNTLFTLPKIDLHRHLEGSIRLATLIEVANQYDIDLPAYDLETLRPFVQVIPGTPPSARNFLSKFDYLRRFYCAPEIIQRLTREAIEDAANDHIKYLELRFTPKALSALKKFSFTEVISWVCAAAKEAQVQTGIIVRLIISVNRHESLEEAEQIFRTALEYRSEGVVALDLAGAEGEYPARPFFDLFKVAQKENLGITIHAGEWSGAQNIRDAIEILGATRIGHGVRIVENPDVIKLACENNTTLEVCVTSNIQSGVVGGIEQHPLSQLFNAGVKTTINTDDPSVSNIALTDELMLCIQKLNLSLDDIKHMTLLAAKSAFLPDEERANLINFLIESHAKMYPPTGDPYSPASRQ